MFLLEVQITGKLFKSSIIQDSQLNVFAVLTSNRSGRTERFSEFAARRAVTNLQIKIFLCWSNLISLEVYFIYVRAIGLITKHNYKISTSFIKNKRYEREITGMIWSAWECVTIEWSKLQKAMVPDNIDMVNPNKYYRRFPQTGDRTHYYTKILWNLSQHVLENVIEFMNWNLNQQSTINKPRTVVNVGSTCRGAGRS